MRREEKERKSDRSGSFEAQGEEVLQGRYRLRSWLSHFARSMAISDSLEGVAFETTGHDSSRRWAAFGVDVAEGALSLEDPTVEVYTLTCFKKLHQGTRAFSLVRFGQV